MWKTLQQEYAFLKIIRETDRGTVWLIQHKDTGHRYILRRFFGSNQAYRILEGIICENLPRIFQVAEHSGQVLVLEEYVEGDTLLEILKGGVLNPRQTRAITRQLCAALHVLHSAGLVHRDLKPENIILRGDQAVLIDFDASRIAKADAASDTVILGTVGYASPEQYGLSQTDGRADIYALGVVINLMLTGTHPSIRLPGGKWGYIVQRCTMTNPQKRFRNVRHLLDLL